MKKYRESGEGKNVLAVFDLDGTLTQRDTYVWFLLEALRRWPARTARCLPLPLAVMFHKFGLRDNTWLKTTFLKSILGGMRRTDVEELARSFSNAVVGGGLKRAGLECLREHTARGHRTVLASASLDVYTLDIANRLGFDDVVCTEVAFDEAGILTGGLGTENCFGDAKLRRVLEASGNDRAAWIMVVYTDNVRDMCVLAEADVPVVVDGDRALRGIAAARQYFCQSWLDGKAPLEQFARIDELSGRGSVAGRAQTG